MYINENKVVNYIITILWTDQIYTKASCIYYLQEIGMVCPKLLSNCMSTYFGKFKYLSAIKTMVVRSGYSFDFITVRSQKTVFVKVRLWVIAHST